jgi:cytochrome c oxidase subunit 2
MLFNVKVVSQSDYQSYLQELQSKGGRSDKPLLGGAQADTQAGVNSDTEGVNK